MFFRIKKSDDRAYVQVVENKRVDGAVRQSVIANLGRADDLMSSGGLASLLASGAKLTDQVLVINAFDEDGDGSLSAAARRIGGPCCSGGFGNGSALPMCSKSCWSTAPSSSRLSAPSLLARCIGFSSPGRIVTARRGWRTTRSPASTASRSTSSS